MGTSAFSHDVDYTIRIKSVLRTSRKADLKSFKWRTRKRVKKKEARIQGKTVLKGEQSLKRWVWYLGVVSPQRVFTDSRGDGWAVLLTAGPCKEIQAGVQGLPRKWDLVNHLALGFESKEFHPKQKCELEQKPLQRQQISFKSSEKLKLEWGDPDFYWLETSERSKLK